MILPIVPYGDPTLRQKTQPVAPDYPGLQQLVADMYETMYNADGVGLAAPQIGKSLRLFVVDTAPMGERDEHPEAEALKTFKRVFINAEKIAESGAPWPYEEGCLSIPGVREDVERPATLRLRYQDEHFVTHEETFTGLIARVIQHEYDHIEGVLFLDHVSPLRRQLAKGKLLRIAKGQSDADYPMRPIRKGKPEPARR